MLLDPGTLGLHSAIAVIATIIWKPSIAVIAEPFLSGFTPFSPGAHQHITLSLCPLLQFLHQAHTLPSLKVFFLKSLPQNSVFERTTHWFLVRCEILRHKRYEVKPFSPKRATFVSLLSKYFTPQAWIMFNFFIMRINLHFQ